MGTWRAFVERIWIYDFDSMILLLAPQNTHISSRTTTSCWEKISHVQEKCKQCHVCAPSCLNSWHRTKFMGKQLVWTCLKRSKHTIFGWNLQSQLFCCENQGVLTHSLIIPNISSIFDGTWGSNPFNVEGTTIFSGSFRQASPNSAATALLQLLPIKKRWMLLNTTWL